MPVSTKVQLMSAEAPFPGRGGPFPVSWTKPVFVRSKPIQDVVFEQYSMHTAAVSSSELLRRGKVTERRDLSPAETLSSARKQERPTNP